MPQTKDREPPKRVPINFGFQSRPGRYGQDGTVRLVNAFSEDAGAEGKAPMQQYKIDGLRPKLTLPEGPVRCMLPVLDFLFVLSGTHVYKVKKDWTFTDVGAISEPGTFATMARDRRETNPQIVLVTGGKAWMIESSPTIDTSTLAQITDPDLPSVLSVAFADGYFIYAIDDQSSGKFMLSGIDDGGAVAALDYATAESDPDRMVHVVRRKGEVWLMGETTIEVWSNNGNAAFPFVRLPGVSIDRGCMSAASVCVLDEMVVWVAEDGTVRAASRYDGVRISHHGVERAIGKEVDKSNISATGMWRDGHTFYVISGTDWTWAVDLSTKDRPWHERKSYGRPRYRAERSCRWLNETVCGSYDSGDLYVVDPEYEFEGADPIVMMMRGPITGVPDGSLQWLDMELEFVAGTGTVEGSSDDIVPTVMMRYSDDGGSHWSSQRSAAMGKVGETGQRARFNKLGQSGPPGRTVEISISAGVRRGIIGANALVRKVPTR